MNTADTTLIPVILCVDDEANILRSLQRLFVSSNVKLLQSSSGQQALELMQKAKVNLIISDMRMPNMTGAEFLAQAAVLQPDAYRILMTGFSDIESTIRSINVGKIHCYIQKPWDNAELLAQVNDGLDIYRLINTNNRLTAKITVQNEQLKELNDNLEETVLQRTTQLKKTLHQYKHLATTRGNEQKATLEVLYNLISINPALSGKFAQHVGETCGNIAKLMLMNQSDIELITRAGLYSELGKLGLPAHCLSHPFYQLDSADQKQYLQHPQLAEDMLVPAVHLSALSEIIACQYERFNGTGEPRQKIADDIPVGARILAVSRDFWLLIYQRQKPKHYTKQEAYKLVKIKQGTLYDPNVVRVLGQLLLNKDEKTDYRIEDGLHVEQIGVGMRLAQNLYNHNHMLLLSKGHTFCEKTLCHLLNYQTKYKVKLLIKVEPLNPAEIISEEKT
ncbi:response regulator [Shewanella sp. 11B5]|uniref:HD domain-containing phosphohydrolase n=1 Tax=Shewanella sp. 11B5 TaxID=2058298 RepID=UPI000C7CF3D3|nr:HD domain-containing phosphohydrolase [Shewanella sp. 11B5]PKH99156.1 response regulator [Shewanella sp. 11B5]